MAPLVQSCCFKFNTRTGSMLIGALLFIFALIFLLVTIGLVAGWEDFDTTFLDDNLNNAGSNKTLGEEDRTKLETLRQTFQEEIRPVWKKEFISLYCFLPWYAIVNLLLIIGAKKEIKILLLLWIAATLVFIIWTFVLVSVMFGYDSTPNFVAGVAVAQLCNFMVNLCLIVVVFSFYQELKAKTIKDVGRNNEGLTEETT